MTDATFNRLKRYSFPVALLAALSVLSAIPGHTDEAAFSFAINLNPTVQNLLHIPLFATIQFFWLRALANGQELSLTAAVFCFVGISLFGVLDEFHQSFVPGRYASFQDVLLNCFGATLGAIIYFQRSKIKKIGKVNQ